MVPHDQEGHGTQHTCYHKIKNRSVHKVFKVEVFLCRRNIVFSSHMSGKIAVAGDRLFGGLKQARITCLQSPRCGAGKEPQTFERSRKMA
jgi:hypothetical protein